MIRTLSDGMDPASISNGLDERAKMGISRPSVRNVTQKSGAPGPGSRRSPARPRRENVMKKRTSDRQIPDDAHVDEPADDRNLVVLSAPDELPPVLAGHQTPEIRARVESLYAGVAELFERWVARRPSPHTQRAHRRDVLSFVDFLGLPWPQEAFRLLIASVAGVHSWRDSMMAETKAPKTLNRRDYSLSSFYKYLAGAAAELRLPITVPNPAHAQFISRESTDPRDETRALSATRARQLMGMPAGDSLLDMRDRAILKFYLYTCARIRTRCKLKVRDFHQDGDEATLTINEKGNKHRTIGIHFAAAEALTEYLGKAGLEAGAIFRARRAVHSDELGDQAISEASMYRVIAGYVGKLPG